MSTEKSMSRRVFHPYDKYDHMVKLSVVGDSRVGKTCLVIRFVTDMWLKSYKPTIVADRHNYMVKEDGKTIKVVMWDVAKGFGTAKTFISLSQGIIIVFDITDMESYRNVKEWLDEFAYYNTDHVNKILVGNKCDLSANRAVTYETAKAFAIKLRIPYIETSAKDGTCVEEAFMTMIRAIKKRTLLSNKPMISVPVLRTFIVHVLCAQSLELSPPKHPDLYVLKLFAVVYASDNPSMKFISSSFFPGHHNIDQKFKFDVNFPSPDSSPKTTFMIEIYVGDLENAEGKLVGWSRDYFSLQSTTHPTSLAIKSEFGEFRGKLVIDIIPVSPGPCTELPLSDPSGSEAAISECHFSFLDITIKFAHLDPSVGSATEVYAVITVEDWLRLPTRAVRCSRNKATWNQAFHVLLSSHFLDSDCPSFTIEIIVEGISKDEKYGSVECSLRSIFGSPLPTHELHSCLLTVGNGAVCVSVGLRPEDKALGLPAMGGPLWSQVPNYLSSLFRGKLLGY